MPEQDATHLRALRIRDLFEQREFSEALIACLDIVRGSVLDGHRRLVVGEHTLAWSGGSSAPGSFYIPAAASFDNPASIRLLVRQILERDPVLSRHVRPAGTGPHEDLYNIV